MPQRRCYVPWPGLLYLWRFVAKMASCDTDLAQLGLFEGEVLLAAVRIATTLISISVTSAWFSWEKIARLGLFFAHWLA